VRWVLLWTVLLFAAAAVYVLLGVRLWRSAKALVSELREAADRLEGAAAGVAAQGADPVRRPAGSPAELPGPDRRRRPVRHGSVA
jgi:hypothetical protein